MDNLSIFLGILSLLLGGWSVYQQLRVSKYLKITAFEDFKRNALLLGSVQQCLRDLQNGNYQSAIEFAGKTEGQGQAIYQKTAGYIQFLYDYDKEMLDDWLKNGKIDDIQFSILKQYIKDVSKFNS